MQQQVGFYKQHQYNIFQQEYQPAFYIYNYRANIIIDIKDTLQSIPIELHLRTEFAENKGYSSYSKDNNSKRSNDNNDNSNNRNQNNNNNRNTRSRTQSLADTRASIRQPSKNLSKGSWGAQLQEPALQPEADTPYNSNREGSQSSKKLPNFNRNPPYPQRNPPHPQRDLYSHSLGQLHSNIEKKFDLAHID